MGRKLRQALLGCSVAVLLGVTGLAAPTVTNIHPATAPGVGSGLVVAVIGDGFTSSGFDLNVFKNASTGLLVSQLLGDAFYAPYATRFTVITVLTTVTTSGSSAYGYSQNSSGIPCDINWFDGTAAKGYTDSTTALVNAAAGAISPMHADYIIVIKNDDSLQRGCFHDNWSYLPSGARFAQGVPQHEFGHLIGGLFDEYTFVTLPFNGTYQGPPGPPVDRENCSTTGSGPYWLTSPMMAGISPPPPGFQGCNHYELDIWRPYDDTCRMTSNFSNPFCQVCDRIMKYALESGAPAAPTNLRIVGASFRPQRQPQQPQFVRSVQLTIRVPRNGGAVNVLAATEVNDVYLKHQKRLGDFAYEVVDNGRVVETGVIPGEPFVTRGEGPGKPPAAAVGESTAVVVNIPQATFASLQSPSRSVSINFYRLKPVSGFGDEVTPEVLNKLKTDATPLGSLSARDLKSFLANMASTRR